MNPDTKAPLICSKGVVILWLLFWSCFPAMAQTSDSHLWVNTENSRPDSRTQKVGLVLSGGGAKGTAHVGVIKALEENGIPIDYVAGTSMGAIVAGLYAIGYSPDEMLELFCSEEFSLWSKGDVEEQYGYFAYRMDPRPDMFWLRFDTKPGAGIKPTIRPNLVSTFPMDLAFLHLFAGATAKSGGDFNKLFVPFRSVASDINANKAFISRQGDLGSAVRASMTFPVFFRPITIDSTLLFDGGLFNNFPWDVMDQDFHPDIIIGSKCVGSSNPVDENDIVALLEKVVMVPTNYDIPAEKGIIISTNFEGINLLDYSKSTEMAQEGFKKTMELMDSIKSRITSRQSLEEVTLRRQRYRASLPPVIFKKITVSGDLNKQQEQFVSRMVPKTRETLFTFEEMKVPYYKMVGTGNVKSFYPLAQFDSTDHTFTLNIHASRAARFRLSVGGNISSASANQGYLGFEYLGWGELLTRTIAEMYFGRLYTSTRVGIRQDYPDKHNLFYEAYGTFSRFDYYRSNADLFFEDVNLTYMKQYDSHLRINLGWPVKHNNVLILSMSAGIQESEYFQKRAYNASLVPERSDLHYITYSVQFKKNSLNYKQYPDKGKFRQFQIQNLTGNIEQKPGSEPATGPGIWKEPIHRFQFLYRERKYKTLSDKWSLGFHFEATYTERHEFSDYYSTIASLPAFRPTPHSESMFMESFRAETWLGAGIIPIYRLGDRTSLQTGWFVMQPYQAIRQGPDNKALYGEKWHKTNIGSFGGFVWQSPIGPLSFTVNYYNSEQKHWYYQLNLGYILFNRKGIE